MIWLFVIIISRYWEKWEEKIGFSKHNHFIMVKVYENIHIFDFI